MEEKTKKIAYFGILLALALILSYVESLVPAFFAVPGMKLGLANVVVLIALYLLDAKSALLINLLRILLAALLFGSVTSFLYSAAGALSSFPLMYFLQKSKRFRMVTVSIFGAVFHNVGQILAAMFLLETSSLLWYLLVLWFTGMVSGALVGLLGAFLCKRLEIAFRHA